MEIFSWHHYSLVLNTIINIDWDQRWMCPRHNLRYRVVVFFLLLLSLSLCLPHLFSSLRFLFFFCQPRCTLDKRWSSSLCWTIKTARRRRRRTTIKCSSKYTDIFFLFFISWRLYLWLYKTLARMGALDFRFLLHRVAQRNECTDWITPVFFSRCWSDWVFRLF